MALGETLIVLRKSKGLSQEQLAEKLDLTRQTISKWELNQSTPDISYIIQLSEFFEVTTDYLIKGEQMEAPGPSQDELVGTDDIHRTIINGGSEKAYKWCFYLGIVGAGVSFAGIIVLVICSIFKPWIYHVNGRVYDGVIGFLLGSQTMWFFIVLVVICIIGVALSVFGIIQNIRMSRMLQQ
ncbi:MAG: helix-turn-helix transcriptional regulator [Lachnospiraceae bacterium]|nr:helix-turn-helix transcriptional regulator [Lachnospiraceae bacterium]